MQIQQAVYQRVPRDSSLSTNRQNLLNDELNRAIDSVSAIFIKQKFEALEVVTQFETENAYFIFDVDPQTQQPLNRIMTAYEKSNIFARNLLPEHTRPFTLELMDNYTGNTLLNIQRPFKCTFLCWARPEMKVFNYMNQTEVLGKLIAPLNCCNDFQFIVNDDQEKHLYTIVGNCCQCSILCKNLPCSSCQNTKFNIINSDGENVGLMSKKTTGYLKSLFSDCDNYYIQFPDDASPTHKYLLLVSALFIDYCLFEGKATSCQNLR